MPVEKVHHKANIGRLREIGWSHWDPIGIIGLMGGWKGETFEDEYDRYLVEVAVMLQKNSNLEEAVDYLFFIESQYMALGPAEITAEIHARLLIVAQEISNDPLIWRSTIN